MVIFMRRSPILALVAGLWLVARLAGAEVEVLSPSENVKSAALEAAKARLQASGIDVVGVTDHAIFKSIYFHDPNGHRLELAADTATPEMMKQLDDVKWAMLDEWSRTRRAPKHAAWMHEKEFAGIAAE